MLERKDHDWQHHGRKRLSGTTKWLDRRWKSGDLPMTQEPQKPYTKRGGQHVQKAWLGAIAIVPTDRNQFLQDKKKTCPRTRAARKPHGSRLPPPPAEVAGQKKRNLNSCNLPARPIGTLSLHTPHPEPLSTPYTRELADVDCASQTVPCCKTDATNDEST